MCTRAPDVGRFRRGHVFGPVFVGRAVISPGPHVPRPPRIPSGHAISTECGVEPREYQAARSRERGRREIDIRATSVRFRSEYGSAQKSWAGDRSGRDSACCAVATRPRHRPTTFARGSAYDRRDVSADDTKVLLGAVSSRAGRGNSRAVSCGVVWSAVRWAAAVAAAAPWTVGAPVVRRLSTG